MNLISQQPQSKIQSRKQSEKHTKQQWQSSKEDQALIAYTAEMYRASCHEVQEFLFRSRFVREQKRKAGKDWFIPLGWRYLLKRWKEWDTKSEWYYNEVRNMSLPHDMVLKGTGEPFRWSPTRPWEYDQWKCLKCSKSNRPYCGRCAHCKKWQSPKEGKLILVSKDSPILKQNIGR